MSDEKIKLFYWEGMYWDVSYDINGDPYPFALCPKQKCCCRLTRSREGRSPGEHKYLCIKCDFKITLNKPLESKGFDFIRIMNSLKYADAEIINIDGELIRVQRETKRDEDYWVDVKISKNKKGELQLMVLAGSRKAGDKTQLFLEPKKERLAYDQNNDHPSQVFTKVVGIFKNSRSEIHSKDN